MGIPPTYSVRDSEHVFLLSDDLEEIVQSTVDAHLEQAAPDSSTRYTIFNGTYLGITKSGKHDRPSRYWINLAFLHPAPIRCADRFWSICAATLTLLTGGALALTFVAGKMAHTLALPAFSVAFLTAICIAMRHYRRRLVFLTSNGRAPVVWLSIDKPDRQRVHEFVENLHAAIGRARARRADMVRGHELRDEMKEHRRLLRDGVLDDRQFRVARRLILEAHG